MVAKQAPRRASSSYEMREKKVHEHVVYTKGTAARGIGPAEDGMCLLTFTLARHISQTV